MTRKRDSPRGRSDLLPLFSLMGLLFFPLGKPGADQGGLTKLVETLGISLEQYKAEVLSQGGMTQEQRRIIYYILRNTGTTNYSPGETAVLFNHREDPLKHFLADTVGSLLRENDLEDPTEFTKRVHAYSLDLSEGIQYYIFLYDDYLGSKAPQRFSPEEEEALTFFHYLLFNPGHEASLLDERDRQNMERRVSSYFAYLGEVQRYLGLQAP